MQSRCECEVQYNGMLNSLQLLSAPKDSDSVQNADYIPWRSMLAYCEALNNMNKTELR